MSPLLTIGVRILSIACLLYAIRSYLFWRKHGQTWWAISLIAMESINVLLQFIPRDTVFFQWTQWVFWLSAIGNVATLIPMIWILFFPKRPKHKATPHKEASDPSFLFVFVNMDNEEKIVEGTLAPVLDEQHQIPRKRGNNE